LLYAIEETAIQEQNVVKRSTVNTTTETPTRPGLSGEIEPETARILAERDNTFDQDKKTAMDARQAIAEIRRNLRTPKPH
jgi:hypothetical protein